MRIIDQDGQDLALAIRQAQYVHHQTVAAATWVIDHPLNKLPEVRVLLSGDDSFGYTEVQYPSRTQAVVLLTAAETGKAYLF